MHIDEFTVQYETDKFIAKTQKLNSIFSVVNENDYSETPTIAGFHMTSLNFKLQKY